MLPGKQFVFITVLDACTVTILVSRFVIHCSGYCDIWMNDLDLISTLKKRRTFTVGLYGLHRELSQ